MTSSVQFPAPVSNLLRQMDEATAERELQRPDPDGVWRGDSLAGWASAHERAEALATELTRVLRRLYCGAS